MQNDNEECSPSPGTVECTVTTHGTGGTSMDTNNVISSVIEYAFAFPPPSLSPMPKRQKVQATAPRKLDTVGKEMKAAAKTFKIEELLQVASDTQQQQQRLVDAVDRMTVVIETAVASLQAIAEYQQTATNFRMRVIVIERQTEQTELCFDHFTLDWNPDKVAQLILREYNGDYAVVSLRRNSAHIGENLIDVPYESLFRHGVMVGDTLYATVKKSKPLAK